MGSLKFDEYDERKPKKKWEFHLEGERESEKATEKKTIQNQGDAWQLQLQFLCTLLYLMSAPFFK